MTGHLDHRRQEAGARSEVKTLVLIPMGAAQIAFWLSSPCVPAVYDKRDDDANEYRQDDTSGDSLYEDFMFVHR